MLHTIRVRTSFVASGFIPVECRRIRGYVIRNS